MRSNRGILGAVGAGSSLIAAVACCLLLVSAVVAQQGWPGMNASVPAIQIVSAQRTHVPGSGTAVAQQIPRLRVSSAPTPHSARARTVAIARVTPPSGSSDVRRQPNVGVITPPSPSSSAPPSSPSKGGGKPAGGSSGTAGGVVQKVTDGVGAAAPPLASTVNGVGSALDSTATALGKTVGQTTAAVGQLAQGVVAGVVGTVQHLLGQK